MCKSALGERKSFAKTYSFLLSTAFCLCVPGSNLDGHGTCHHARKLEVFLKVMGHSKPGVSMLSWVAGSQYVELGCRESVC